MWANSEPGLRGVSDNLTSGNAKLDCSRNGNAADAAYRSFSNVATEIDKLGPPQPGGRAGAGVG